MMRKTESILLMPFSLLLTGTERERAIIPWVSLPCKRTTQIKAHLYDSSLGHNFIPEISDSRKREHG